MNNIEIERQRVDLLSDTVFYAEAQQFVQGRQIPDSKQLMGLATFSRNWSELLAYVNHQSGRDWGARDYYKLFYDDLRKYLNDSKTGLRQRVKTEFELVSTGLTKREETTALDTWAQVLAQEFIQHLVAEARLKT